MSKEIIKIELGEDSIKTSPVGMKQLLRFYDKAQSYADTTIHISLANIIWLDGNLCALLGALLYDLNKRLNLRFTLDSQEVIDKCNVLFHNEFLPIDYTKKLGEKKSSCIPFKAFYPHQKDEFVNYILEELLVHEGMPKFNEDVLEKLLEDLNELYANVNKHAETEDPFFVCGQYYPKSGKVIFTISDLGTGFFPKIKKARPDIIHSDGDAIIWALEGNSTKPDAPGGTGLKGMKKYFQNNSGGMHVLTGDTCWNSEAIGTVLYENGIVPMNFFYRGSTINLIFNKNNLV